MALDDLAKTITAVKYVQSHPGVNVPMPLDEQQAVIREADKVVAELRKVNWRDDEQMRPSTNMRARIARRTAVRSCSDA